MTVQRRHPHQLCLQLGPAQLEHPALQRRHTVNAHRTSHLDPMGQSNFSAPSGFSVGPNRIGRPSCTRPIEVVEHEVAEQAVSRAPAADTALIGVLPSNLSTTLNSRRM
jgi:hypothetical protein